MKAERVTPEPPEDLMRIELTLREARALRFVLARAERSYKELASINGSSYSRSYNRQVGLDLGEAIRVRV